MRAKVFSLSKSLKSFLLAGREREKVWLVSLSKDYEKRLFFLIILFERRLLLILSMRSSTGLYTYPLAIQINEVGLSPSLSSSRLGIAVIIHRISGCPRLSIHSSSSLLPLHSMGISPSAVIRFSPVCVCTQRKKRREGWRMEAWQQFSMHTLPHSLAGSTPSS